MLQRLSAASLVLFTVGCAGPVVPTSWVAAPGVETSIDHFQGTPFSGPRIGYFSDDPAEPSTDDSLTSLAVLGDTFFVSGAVVESWAPLEASVRLLTDPMAAQPILVRGQLLSDVRLLTYSGALPLREDGLSSVRLAALPGVLDRGMTCEVTITDRGQPGRLELLSLQLNRPAEGGELLAILSSQRLDKTGQLMDWEQAVLSEGPTVGRSGLALAIPSNDGLGFFVLTASVEEAPADPEQQVLHAERVSAARLQAGLRHEGMLALVERFRGAIAEPTDLLAALSGLGETTDQRGMVLYLAEDTGARLAYDLALVGNKAILARICADTLAATQAGEPLDSRGLAWALDGAGWRSLAEVAAAEEPELGLMGVLLRHAGEVGRDPALLLELVEAAKNRQAFDNALLTENLGFLEVNVPAARVRAYDWLLSRDQSPKGYDPHDDRQTRRAALKRFAETGETGL